PTVKVRFREGPTAEWQEVVWSNLLRDALPGRPPESIPSRESNLTVWVVVGLGTLTTVLLVAGLLLRQRRRAPALSPTERALRGVDEVVRNGFAASQLHARLADVVRAFLAERFQLPAPRQTTAEFLAKHAQQLPERARAPLADFLNRCDLAKF